MELFTKRGGDVMDVNAMAFIYLNIHPWFILDLYLTLSLILVHYLWTSS
jgi:hypothetical protein